ncbi:hypothetical protein Ahy_A03g015617 [Arachis hypogaea]|uniref:Uncharacterized protein n=1 Tax=Arachis hypogaea TaxID=3818 RepID=A0A445E106_ARAHY|nr:hypothetical protein Ahy_A03g015617 [Arachis hypogaea]
MAHSPPPSNGDVSVAGLLQLFRLLRSELRPEPQTTNGVQVTEPCNEDIDSEANKMNSFDEYIDRMFATFNAEKRTRRKTTGFWDVDFIDSDGIVKQTKMSVKGAMERSLNDSKIILRFNEKLQAVGDRAGLLSGILGAWVLITANFLSVIKVGQSWTLSLQEMFHFQEDSGGRIKKTFLQQIGRSWKDTRGRLYDSHYKPTRTLEQNLDNRLARIPREHWRWFIDYRNNPATKAKCKKNTLNRKKQFYTYTDDSKSLAKARKEEPPVDRAQIEETQRMLFELQVEVTAKKLRRKVVEDEVTVEKLKKKAMKDKIVAEKTKRQVLETVLSYVVQQQGEKLSLDIAAQDLPNFTNIMAHS